MSVDTLFFDLDGTLVDSEQGIVASIQYALAGLGRPVPSREELLPWIGPPLRDSFGQLFPHDPALVERALALYRERYGADGWRELRVFDGIPEAIGALRSAGHRLAVVTSKNEGFARRIIGHLPFGACFEEVVGASDDGHRRFKVDLIAEALRRLAVVPARCWMTGDRHMDMEGAVAHRMRCVGVLWGFGSRKELSAAGATRLVDAPAQLPQAYDA